MTLEKLREKIDKLDGKLLEILAARFSVVEEINKVKKKQNKPVFDLARENKLLDKISSKSKEIGLDNRFTRILFGMLLDESKRIQRNEK